MSDTKITQYDLNTELNKVFQELNIIKGTFNTLDERFANIDMEMLAAEEKEVISDLIAALNNDFKGSAMERVRKIEETMEGLKDSLAAIDPNQLEEGNFTETFTYTDGDVTRHVSTGDNAFIVEYGYTTNASGGKDITSSVKTFTRMTGETVKINKVYSYNTNGDISQIVTTTTIIPAT